MGLPDDGYCTFHIELDRVLAGVPVEDGLHMLIAWGGPALVRRPKARRRKSYERFVADARLLQAARRAWLGADRRREPLQAPEHRARNR